MYEKMPLHQNLWANSQNRSSPTNSGEEAKRRMVGTAVRYYNTDIQKYILSLPEDPGVPRKLPEEQE